MSNTIPLASGKAFPSRPLVMGILNCTPDSFFDGGRHDRPEDALRFALQMIEDGADVLDLGGESTRPGSRAVSVPEEMARVLPVIELLRRHSDVPLSIDTSKEEVARAALNAGADIINDITALTGSPKMAELAAEKNAPVILMHMRGLPQNMQDNPAYGNVTEEVCGYLLEQARFAESKGIARDKIILDPGFGFGKTFAHNCRLLRELPQIRAHGYPVLVGVSRKSMIGHALGLEKEDRLIPSVALAVMAFERGAGILRVHDVKETRQALDMAAAVI
jgi:dihydropteroate synthase